MFRDGQETPFEVRGIVPLGKNPSQPNFQVVP